MQTAGLVTKWRGGLSELEQQAGETMSTIKKLIAELEAGKLPAAKDIEELCYALHGAQVDKDAPELLWMSTSFEDMADVMTKAIECSEREFAELMQEEAACAA